MKEKRAIEILAAHADTLTGRPKAMQSLDVKDEEHTQLAPLFQLAERLHQSMQPVKPSADFVRSLRRELVENARRQIKLKKRMRRVMVIGAAALGSLVSIMSVVGAAIFVIKRLRARAQALQAPMS